LITHPPFQSQAGRKPPWLKVKLPTDKNFFLVSSLLQEHGLNTICRSAKCPNIGACWAEKTATFLILGDTCSRSCSFCAVNKGFPAPPIPGEPEAVAEAAAAMGLTYIVITSVTRDDLVDGGASEFTRTIEAIRKKIPGAKVEALVPDFAGNEEALRGVVRAAPEILNHNLETVEALYPRINRPEANYRRSLEILKKAKSWGASTKSGLMVGLGETEEDLIKTFRELSSVSCDLLTLGQYLQPTQAHAPVARFYAPEEFDRFKDVALSLGFSAVAAGPLVRSSFHARALYDSLGKI
jgi:lipoic acid synthetase